MQIRLLQAFADLTSVAMENVARVRELEQRAERDELLAEVAALLHRSSDTSGRSPRGGGGDRVDAAPTTAYGDSPEARACVGSQSRHESESAWAASLQAGRPGAARLAFGALVDAVRPAVAE